VKTPWRFCDRPAIELNFRADLVYDRRRLGTRLQNFRFARANDGKGWLNDWRGRNDGVLRKTGSAKGQTSRSGHEHPAETGEKVGESGVFGKSVKRKCGGAMLNKSLHSKKVKASLARSVLL
jgi:hypothetical protein